MKILMISRDRSVFNSGSDTNQRMFEYGRLADKLHILVLSRPFQSLKIGKEIKGFDLVTAQDPFETGLIGWLIAKILKARLQLQIHTDFMSPYFKKESLLNRTRVLIAKFLIPRADCIRVVSRRIKTSLDFAKAPSENRLSLSRPRLRFSGGTFAPPITILPIFVDVEKIKSAPIKTNLRVEYPQFDFIILMASRLAKVKNIGLAIAAMREVVKEYPKTGLIIVGDGPEREALKSSAVSRRLSANIIFEPWTDDLPSYYKTADLFLLTSNYEGYGRTVAEAMAAGCLVVMTDVGVSGELVRDRYSGIVVPAGDKKKLAEAILEMARDRALRNNLALSAENIIAGLPKKREYLREYKKSWEKCRY